MRLPIWIPLALTFLATACATGANALSPSPDAAPLPLGWRETPARWPQPQPGRWDAPLWGVPSISAPSARDCHRAPQTREIAGNGWTPRQPARSIAASPARESESMRAAGAADSMASADRAERKAAAPGIAPTAPALAAAPEALGQLAPGTVMRDRRSQAGTPVTAGMVDDNADFSEYLAYLQRRGDLGLRERDVSERYRVTVRDARNRPVADAELALSWSGASAGLVWARTDAAGNAWLHPRALVAPAALDGLGQLQLMARAPTANLDDDAPQPIARATLQRGQKAGLTLRLPEPDNADRWARPARPALDLVFLMDATGSMGDEIAKLKTSVRDIADQIARMPGQPDLCLGLVAYRDHGDEFLVRRTDLTNDLPAFQSVLGRLRADNGGDEPEALNQALQTAVDDIAWRGPGTTRMVVLIADAPPHLDQGGPYYDQSTAAALARGIKLHAVGASGLNPQGEGVFRQIAQGTGGRFVFLTYRDATNPGSGPGSDTVHDVKSYSVQTLDRLIVQLVKDELALRAGG